MFRQAYVSVSINGSVLLNVLAVRCTFGFEGPSEAYITVPVPPSFDNFDATVIIQGGCTGPNLSAVRFVGYIREYDFELYPGACTIVCKGPLTRALERENADDPANIGGLRLFDLLGGSNYGTDQAIVTAVLNHCGITGAMIGSIDGTGRNMGNMNLATWIWRAGTPTDPEHPQLFADAGETGWAYIQEVDKISAAFNSGSGSGGFYTTYDGISGKVYRKLIGGRPRSAADYTFTEGVDILMGQFKRSFPIGNYVVVKGFDNGIGNGPVIDALQENNPYMPSTSKWSDSYSSPLIEWATEAQATAEGTVLGLGGPEGMSCELVKNARMLDINRVIVTGQATTGQDYLIWPGQTHQVQGPAGMQARLGVGEKLWCRHLEINWVPQGSVFVFSQTMQYIGGGTPDSGLGLPPS